MSDMNIDSEERLAYELLEAGDYHQAQQLLLSLAQQDSVYAWNALGWMHHRGAIGQIDNSESISCYRKAAEGGFSEAFFSIGVILLEKGDEQGALQAFEEGANLGDLRSMYWLGHFLIDTDRTDFEKEEGLVWLKRAAAKGHLFAQRRILSIEMKSEKSLLKKLILALKVLPLTYRSTVLFLKDRNSERL